MRTQRLSKWGLGLLLMTLIIPFQLYAGDDEIKKDQQKTFDLTQKSTVYVENKYGNISIENWEQDKVEIRATVTVEHSNSEKAREILDHIYVEIFQDGDMIKAITSIDEKINRSVWFVFGSNDRNYQIDYDIKLPVYANVNLQNKYGDVFINELSGHALINVKYGNLKANKLSRANQKPLNEIELGYSNGWIEEASWLKLSLKYAPKMEIEKATALIVVSRYSKLFVQDCSSIVADAKYDDYRLGDITNFVGEAAYSDFEIDRIDEKLDVDMRYGGVDVEHIPASFKSIRIDNNYGSIDLGIDNTASYMLTGEARYGDIDYPSNSRVNRIDESNELRLNGKVGNEPEPTAEVWIKTKYGSVELD
ncbi:MAG: hypothetical protein R6U66_10000 [Bacteroidales bacterium]